jgi:PAS domain S-box-containing protein
MDLRCNDLEKIASAATEFDHQRGGQAWHADQAMAALPLLECSEDGYLALDALGRVTYLNPVAARMLGRASAELARQVLWEAVPTLRGSPLETLCRQAMTDGVAGTPAASYEDEGRWYQATCSRTASGLAVCLRDVGGARAAAARASAQADHLEGSARTFESLIDGNPFGIYVVDASFRIARVSKGAQKTFANVRPLLGRDLAEVLHTLWPEPFASEAINRFRHTLATGEPYVATGTVEHRADIDETEAYDWRLERIALPDGQRGVICYFYDLTERQQLEARLRETEARRALALKAGRLAAWEYDVVTGHNHWDASIAELLGIAPERAPELESQWLQFVHPDDRRRVETAFLAALGQTAPYQIEFRLQRADGTTVWIESRAECILDADGRPVRLIGLVQDVTDRKRSQAALEASDDRLSISLEAVHAGAFDWTVENGEIHWTAGHFRLLGLAPGSAAPSYALWRRHVHPDDVEHVEAALRRAIDLAQPYHAEYRVLGADRSERWVTGHGLIVQRDGAPTRMVGAIVDVTERKRIETSLAAREAEFRALADSMPQMVWATRPGGYHDYYNARWYEFTGVPPGSTDGEAWNGMFHPDDQPRAWERWRQSLTTGEAYEIEYRLRYRDGSYRWVLGRALPLKDAQGQVLRWFGTCTDIDEVRRTGEELRIADARLRLATESARIGPWDIDYVAGVSRWSPQAAALFGIHEGTGSLEGWIEAIHPADRARVAAAWQRTVLENAPYEVELRSAIPACDGGERWFLSRGHIERDEQGRPRYASGVFVDITERKRAEYTLRESEERFRVMADGVPAIIWVTDATGRIEFANAGYCEFFGCTIEQVQRDGWQPLLHPDDEAAYAEGFSRAMRERAPFQARARVRHRSGEWRYVNSHGVPRLSADGAYSGHVGMSPDITELVMSAQALRESDRVKDRFLATLSHELRNPLAPIRTAAQILSNPKLDSEQLASARRIIQRQVRHMAWLLDDLLDVARITQGKLELKKGRVSLTGAVDAAVEAARPLLDRKHHRLTVTLPADDPEIDGDVVRVTQILSNLLTNAAKYTDPHGRIDVAATVTFAHVEIEVRDNGIGIAPEALPTLFTMFSQVSGAGSRSEGGLGIGLALIKGLVELHGGAIQAASDGAGCGSTFIVRLPLVVGDADRGSTEPGEQAATEAARRRILVVDDNRDAATALGMLLELAGHEVRIAHDGSTALSLARTFRPVLALLDIGMPGMNGYELAKALRSEPWSAALCLAALTGWGQEEDRSEAHQAGFDHHLTKPVDPHAVEALVAQCQAPAPRTQGR